MRQYFIYNGNVKEGPFVLEKLQEHSLTKDMLVWYEGLGSWTKAKSIPELTPLLHITPPPLPKNIEPNNADRDGVIKSFGYAEEINEGDDKKTLLLPVLITLIIIAGLLITLFYYHK